MRRPWLLIPLVVSIGCATFGRRNDDFAAKPSYKGESFFAYWNGNADKIDSLYCRNVRVDGRSQGQPYEFKANLAYQKGNRFRLTGRVLGKQEVDLGSNEREIWFWIARAEPPAVYFCPREDLARVKNSMPFQPDWIIEALGVSRLDADEYRESAGKAGQRFFESQQRGYNGEPVVKRIVVNGQTNRVDAFELLGRGNRLVAKAQITEYFDDPQTGVFFPRKVLIDWPEADTRLTMTVNTREATVNDVTQEMAGRFFTRGRYTNAEEINLAERIGRGRGNNMAQASAPPRRNATRETERQLSRELDDIDRPNAGIRADNAVSSTFDNQANAYQGQNRYRDPGVRPARAAAELTGQIEPAAPRRSARFTPGFSPER